MLNFIMTVLGLVVLVCIFVTGYYGKIFANDYNLNLVIAPKGVGKTTLLTKLSLRDQHNGRDVYSNIRVPGDYHILADDIGKYKLNENSVVHCDEGGVIYDNRKFKEFGDYTRDFYVYQRQYKCTVYIYSQAYNTDLKLKDLCDFVWLGKKYFNCISVFRKYKKKQILIRATPQTDARFGEDFVPVPIVFGGLVVTFIPRWAKYFKSFDPPKLPQKNFKQVPFPVDFVAPRFGVKEHIKEWYHVFSCRIKRSGIVRKLLAVFHKSTDTEQDVGNS